MTEIEKREKKRKANRKYYETHPERKIKARERERNNRKNSNLDFKFAQVIPLKFRGVQERAIKQSDGSLSKRSQMPEVPFFKVAEWFRLEVLILVPLVSLLTILLLREMYLFYIEGGQSHFWAGLQAGAGEYLILTFSSLRGKTLFEQFQYKSLVLALCGFSVYSVSARQVGVTFDAVHHSQGVEEIIENLRIAVTEKSAERDRYISQQMIWPARKVQRDIDALRVELKSKIESQSSIKSVPLSSKNLISQLVFRILLFLANIMAVRRLTESFSTANKVSEKNREQYGITSEMLDRDTEISVNKLEARQPKNRKILEQFQPRIFQKIRHYLAYIISDINLTNS